MCSSRLLPTVLYLCCLYSYLYQQTLILQAGDVETNPGPRAPRFPCGECNKACSSYRGAKASILCDTCNSWFHADCIGISDPVLDVLGRCDLPWECYKCGFTNISSGLFDTFNLSGEVSDSSTNTSRSSHSSTSSTPGSPLAKSSPTKQSAGNKTKINSLRTLEINFQSIFSKSRNLHVLLMLLSQM